MSAPEVDAFDWLNHEWFGNETEHNVVTKN